MPNKVEEDQPELSPKAEKSLIFKRLRPRWQRWLLWATVRLLLLASMGIGIGTVERLYVPNLMAHARRVASLDGFSGFHLDSDDEITLVKMFRSGAQCFRWSISKRTLAALPPNPKFDFRLLTHQPYAKSYGEHNGMLTVRTWNSSPVALGSKGGQRPPDHEGKLRIANSREVLTVSIAFSPDNKRVACVCWRRQPEFWTSLRHRIQPSFKTQQNVSASLYVSNLNGSNTRCLGSVKSMPNYPSPYNLGKRVSFTFLDCQWLSDSKHLLFAYGDGIYVLPVN